LVSDWSSDVCSSDLDREGNVFFTDQPNDRIVKYNAADGSFSDWLKPAGRSNGTYFDDAGNLIAKYDVLILPDGATFARTGARSPPRINPDDVPPEYRERLGAMTVAKSVPQLQEFLNAGGTILAVGSATDLGIQLQLPIANALVDSAGRALPRTRFYVHGSILSMRVDTTLALADGLRPVTDFYYDNAPAFRLLPAAEARGIRRVVWVDGPSPLRSGWAWGQRYLNGVTEVLQAPVGKGMLVLYGPDPYFRSQPHGTFKLLFNGILYRNELGD